MFQAKRRGRDGTYFDFNGQFDWPIAVSKFKPRLPAQWAVGTHRKGPSRMEKVASRMNDQSEIRLKFEIKFSL